MDESRVTFSRIPAGYCLKARGRPSSPRRPPAYRHLEKARAVAEDEFRDLNRRVGQHIATTPEGMAALVCVIGLYPWKDTGDAWANLLVNAAIVASIDPSSLEHEHASTRADRA